MLYRDSYWWVDLLYLITDYIFHKLRLSAFLKNKMNEWMNEFQEVSLLWGTQPNVK